GAADGRVGSATVDGVGQPDVDGVVGDAGRVRSARTRAARGATLAGGAVRSGGRRRARPGPPEGIRAARAAGGNRAGRQRVAVHVGGYTTLARGSAGREL